MTRVDFYIIPQAQDTGPVLTACRLCEKATRAGQLVFVHAPAGHADDLDSAMWTFKLGSFVAHSRYTKDSEDADITPVLLGLGDPPPQTHHQVLVNLDHEVPNFFSRFERVLEIVHGDTQQRAAARKRYQYYRERGYTLDSHEL